MAITALPGLGKLTHLKGIFHLLVRGRYINRTADGAELERLRAGTQAAVERLEADVARHHALEAQFTMVGDRQSLLDHQARLASERDALVGRIENAAARTPESIEREIVGVNEEMARLQRELASFDDNLHRRLHGALGAERGSMVGRLASRDALALGPSAFSLDDAVFVQACAGSLEGSTLRLPGLSVDLSALPSPPAPSDRASLEQALEDQQARCERLEGDLETARSIEKARQHREALEEALRKAEAAVVAFDDLTVLRASARERADELQVRLTDREDLKRRLANLDAEGSQLRKEERDAAKAIDALDADHRTVCHHRDQRRDGGPAFEHLSARPHHQWTAALNIALDQLPAALEGYKEDCLVLSSLEQSLRSNRQETMAEGFTKFQGSVDGGMEAEIERMARFVDALAEEAEALDKAARVAVVEVASALKDLRRSLDEMAGRVADFNKLISQRKLSDLEVFRVKLVPIDEIVTAIDTILSAAQTTGQDEAFELFEQGAVLDDDAINHAKTRLIREGQHNNGLKLENLFRLEFHVAKAGQAVESFQDIDQAASLGTVLMAKLVIGLAMLHLMRDKRHPTQAVCYLDEAAGLDEANQRSLIALAREFGFSLVMAAPTALTTARYCLPIDRSPTTGRNVISRQRWQVLEHDGDH